MSTIFLRIFNNDYLLAPQKSPLPLETMSQFDEPVIPDESDCSGRDPWFDRPFDRLTVLSKVEGLTTLSKVEGVSSKPLLLPRFRTVASRLPE
jgi:hypothetical protein